MLQIPTSQRTPTATSQAERRKFGMRHYKISDRTEATPTLQAEAKLPEHGQRPAELGPSLPL